MQLNETVARILKVCYNNDRSLIVTIGLLLTTFVLSCALVLTMAEEFKILPKQLQNISSTLVQNRAFRTLFICGVVTLMCFASTISLVIFKIYVIASLSGNPVPVFAVK